MTILDTHWGVKLDAQVAEKLAQDIKAGRRDEFGVRLVKAFANEIGRSFCISEAPGVEAVRRSHEAKGLACEEVMPINCIGC